jgi:hypothetical protein
MHRALLLPLLFVLTLLQGMGPLLHAHRGEPVGRGVHVHALAGSAMAVAALPTADPAAHAHPQAAWSAASDGLVTAVEGIDERIAIGLVAAGAAVPVPTGPPAAAPTIVRTGAAPAVPVVAFEPRLRPPPQAPPVA